MALLAPALILILFGIVEMGRFAHFSILVHNAARAGAQYGAQNLITAIDAPGMQTAALNDAQNTTGVTSTATFYCQCADGTAAACSATACSADHRVTYVQVGTQGTFVSLFHYPGLPPSLTIAGSSIMRVSQ